MAERADERTWPPVGYWMRVTAGVVVVLLAFRVAFVIGDILVLTLVSLVLAMGLQPAIEWLRRRGLSRGWSVAIIFVVFLGAVGAFLGLMIPTLVREVGGLIDQLPEYARQIEGGEGFLGRVQERFDLAAKLDQLARQLPGTVLSGLRGAATALFTGLTLLTLVAFFATALPRLRRGVARLLVRDHREEFLAILKRSTDRVGGYVIGILTVGAIAGTVSFAFFLVLGLPFAAALAFWTALTDLIPTVGALFGAALAAVVAAFVGPAEVIAVVAFFLVYQQVENYLIQPRVMGKAIDLSFGAVILSVIVGGALAGVVGALLALPVAAIVKIAVEELYLRDRLEEVKDADAAASKGSRRKSQAGRGKRAAPKPATRRRGG